jgi:drug/metabolite transporter (DMT)-like permease
MTIAGVLVLTPDAVMLRLVEADHWTVLFWRSVFSAVCLFAFIAIANKTSPLAALRDLVKNGLFCAIFYAGANLCFVYSITHTTAANTLVILASMPFIAAVMSVVLLRKNLAARTWLTICVGMAGILMVFWGRFGAGGADGDIVALFCALFMAATLMMINRNPKIDSLAAVSLGSVLAAMIALFMGAGAAAPSLRDFVYLAANGAIIIPIAMGLITYGPKLISAPEVSLILLLETVLGPLWVWWVLSEQPLAQTFLGGSLVIAAIVAHAWMSFRSSRASG